MSGWYDPTQHNNQQQKASTYLKLKHSVLKCLIWDFSILRFFTNFYPIKIDLSGNIVWQTLAFKN